MKTILVLIFFICINSAQAQVENFLGHWKGDLHISGTSEVVKMQLVISETETPDKWSWSIIYGDDNTVSRNYFLFSTDDISRYILDEDNSIKLDFFYNDNTFFSTFIVMENFLSSSYRLVEDKLLFQIISSNLKDEIITGGEGEIPEVSSVKIYNTQFAILSRH